MAFNVNMPDNLFDKYNFTDSELREIVADVAPILQKEMQKSISNVISDSADSALVKSVKVSKPKVTKTDAVVSFVGPSGKDKKGVRNIEKGIYLCYGTKHQPARPWLAKAVNDASKSVVKKMEEAVERKLNK